jgi:ABC-type uncharacterized transport system substrate-binding protein
LNWIIGGSAPPKENVIVTWFTPTAVAAKQATREIPIVMAETGDPIGTGLVMSLPGSATLLWKDHNPPAPAD